MSNDLLHRIDTTDYDGLSDDPVATLELSDEAQTRRLGTWFGERLSPGDFVGLVGELGAGKTTFVQGLVAGVDPEHERRVTSPTYALIQQYETTPVVLHIDLYRLDGWADLESIGYWDAVERRGAMCCVEWLDRIPGAWPGAGIVVELVHRSNSRMALIFADEDRAPSLEDIDESISN